MKTRKLNKKSLDEFKATLDRIGKQLKIPKTERLKMMNLAQQIIKEAKKTPAPDKIKK